MMLKDYQGNLPPILKRLKQVDNILSMKIHLLLPSVKVTKNVYNSKS